MIRSAPKVRVDKQNFLREPSGPSAHYAFLFISFMAGIKAILMVTIR